jgi:hypothetical protein
VSDPTLLLATAIALVDVALAFLLLGMWGVAYRRVRARVTFGLVLAAGAFAGQNILTATSYLLMLPAQIPSSLFPLLAGIAVFEGIALGALIYTALT